jgi:RNA recognition motif-containing protein
MHSPVGAIRDDVRKRIQAGRLPPTVHRFGRSTSMSSNIYVGNLTFNTGSDDLERLFAEYGEVERAAVITDRDTGRSRGFGFVEMASDDAAKAAIEALNGKNVDGRELTVNVAKERSR